MNRPIHHPGPMWFAVDDMGAPPDLPRLPRELAGDVIIDGTKYLVWMIGTKRWFRPDERAYVLEHPSGDFIGPVNHVGTGRPTADQLARAADVLDVLRRGYHRT